MCFHNLLNLNNISLKEMVVNWKAIIFQAKSSGKQAWLLQEVAASSVTVHVFLKSKKKIFRNWPLRVQGRYSKSALGYI